MLPSRFVLFMMRRPQPCLPFPPLPVLCIAASTVDPACSSAHCSQTTCPACLKTLPTIPSPQLRLHNLICFHHYTPKPSPIRSQQHAQKQMKIKKRLGASVLLHPHMMQVQFPLAVVAACIRLRPWLANVADSEGVPPRAIGSAAPSAPLPD